jgi:hypothetical protein
MTRQAKGETDSPKWPKPAAASFPMSSKDHRTAVADQLAAEIDAFDSSSPSASTPPASESLHRQAAAAKHVAARKHPVVNMPEFCLVVAHDGDWPTLDIFSDVESLARRIRSLEGQQVNAFPFFGIPVPFTRGPDRFLQLPSGVPHPVFELSRYGKFVPDPQAMLPVDPSYSLAADERQGTAPQSAVVDHRPVGSGTKDESGAL